MTMYGFDFIFPLMFVLVFTLVAATFVVTLVRGASEWSRNNRSPKLSIEATCISKRTEVTHHREPVAGDVSGAHGYTQSSDTRYYAAFEASSGDRMEFRIPGPEYGMLREGDTGSLSFQGTRYLSFERNPATGRRSIRTEDVDFEVEQNENSDVEVLVR